MFIAQLAAFLTAHHHVHWAEVITTVGPRKFAHIYLWAQRHGFVFQR